MSKQLADIILAIAVLATGIILLAIGEKDLGSLSITTSLGYIAGAFRDKPGGLDEAVKTGLAELEILDNKDTNNNA